MKKYYIILFLLLLSFGCTKDVWLDHDDPRVYIPKNGLSINKAWLLESNEYTIDISVYCSGLRQENRKKDIVVDFAIAPELITEYNNDITQQYSGQIAELPADCYTVTDTKAVIGKGATHAEVPIKLDLNKIKNLGLEFNEIKYVIPIKLKATSMYALQEETEMLEALYCITIDEPSFYFWDNRDADVNVIAKTVTFDADNYVNEYRLASYGLGQVMSEDYKLNVTVDPTVVPNDGIILPSNAYEMPASVDYAKGKSDAFLSVKVINNNLEFLKTYYLPIKISSTSKYKAHENKSTLMLKYNLKNDYERTYSSKMIISSNDRSASGTGVKVLKSYSKDVVTMDLYTAYYAVADNYDYGVAAYFYYSLGIKITPTSDKRKHTVELIKTTPAMTGKQWYGYQSPTTVELDPDNESYFDWDYETFYLNYRYRKGDSPTGVWVYVSEILEAQ